VGNLGIIGLTSQSHLSICSRSCTDCEFIPAVLDLLYARPLPMSKPAPDQSLLYLMLRAQQFAKQGSGESGYAMMLVSIVTVMMLSLLTAYLTISNISRAATNAYTESNSTFYAAESGLNQRSDAVRQKFVGYATPTGVSPGAVAGTVAGPENIANCLDTDTTNDGSGDFACQTLVLNYQQSTGASGGKSADGKSDTVTSYNNKIKYNAYTFTSDRTNYADPVNKIPQVQPIPSGQVYAGLSAQEYRYTIYSMATSKQSTDLDARSTTVLEMTFKNRVIPLFQFAAFYNGDLEMNSTSQMDINGRVHTNGNLYVQPTPYSTASGEGCKKSGCPTALSGDASTRLLGEVTAANRIYNRVDASNINRHGITNVLLTGISSTPDAATNVYEPFPAFDVDRITPLTATEINKFQRKVLDGLTGATTLNIPQPGFLRKRDPDGDIGEYYGKADLRLEMVPKRVAGNVPFNFAAIRSGGTGGGSCATFEISTGRQGTINCNQLNEGQRRSLQQPVMAKVLTLDERNRFCPTLTKNHTATNLDERKVLRALQVAIAAQNTPVSLAQLSSSPLSSNASISAIATGLDPSLVASASKTPVEIAAAAGACFLPAPIQLLSGTGSGTNANYNWESNYFDRREERWIGMLQTNIASLTIWNRDGLYVDRDNAITTNDEPTTALKNAAFNGGNNVSAYDTDNLLFVRAGANATAPVGSFQRLGLGSNDATEGGLVFHATVNDDFNDDGTPDITVDPVDKLRNYTDGKKKSSYGFAFSAGADLPGALTVVTDQALYVQGDYNSFAANAGKQPASLIGDTITVLSNSCAGATTGMIDCGVITATQVATTTSVNAAFLSYTDFSNGNIGSSGFTSTPKIQKYSGGLNNYMRMVEDWGGINFNYTGSFVSLGAPQEYSGAYRAGSGSNDAFVAGGSYYDVPNRNFNYDTNFNAFDKLPPLTPKVIYLQQETFKRSYR
jgi:hypothetical protein